MNIDISIKMIFYEFRIFLKFIYSLQDDSFEIMLYTSLIVLHNVNVSHNGYEFEMRARRRAKSIFSPLSKTIDHRWKYSQYCCPVH